MECYPAEFFGIGVVVTLLICIFFSIYGEVIWGSVIERWWEKVLNLRKIYKLALFRI